MTAFAEQYGRYGYRRVTEVAKGEENRELDGFQPAYYEAESDARRPK